MHLNQPHCLLCCHGDLISLCLVQVWRPHLGQDGSQEFLSLFDCLCILTQEIPGNRNLYITLRIDTHTDVYTYVYTT